jgi:hypothetical protein
VRADTLTVHPERSDDDPRVDGRRLAALRAMPYAKYLKTPEWKWTKATALELAGHACSVNPAHTEDLEVYHRTYDRQGAEQAADLAVLCRSCRHLYHREDGERPRRERLGRQRSMEQRRGAPSRPSLLQRLLG